MLDVSLRENAQRKSGFAQARALINALACNLLRRAAPKGGWRQEMIKNCQDATRAIAYPRFK